VLLQPNLEAEILQLQIGRITVKLLSAIRGKIKLLHPSEGTFPRLCRLNVRTITLRIEIPLSREGFVVPCDTTGFKHLSLFS